MSIPSSLRSLRLLCSRTNLLKLHLSPASRLPQRSFRLQPNRHYASTSGGGRQYLRFSSPRGANGEVPAGTKVVIVLGATGVAYYVLHLERVPETGRWRFMDVSQKYEEQIAREAHAELERELKPKVLPSQHVLTRHVRRVVERILSANNLGTLRDADATSLAVGEDGARDGWGAPVGMPPEAGGRLWNLMVVNDPKVVNAMAAFGNIVVFTGILPVCKDEQGLAAVLGHEIGHSVARHSSERLSTAKFVMFLYWGLFLLGVDFGVSSILTTVLVDLPNSRKAEYEADEIGMSLCAKACYDPEEAIKMQQRLARADSGSSNRFDVLYTHPASQKRITRLRNLLSRAYALRAETPECGTGAEEMRAFGAATAAFTGRSGGVPSTVRGAQWGGAGEGTVGGGGEGEFLQDKW